LTDVASLDPALFAGLPHPWVVSEDAHINPLELLRFVNRFMQPGDYFVKEDVLLYLRGATLLRLAQALEMIDGMGLLVDTAYTDGFDLNLSTAGNFWLRKS